MPEQEWDCVRKKERGVATLHTTIGYIFYVRTLGIFCYCINVSNRCLNEETVVAMHLHK